MTNSRQEIDHLAALERLDRIATAFASMVSHETRSALVGIQGLSEMIRDGDLSSSEMRAAATDIFTDAQRINQLIGELLDLSRLESRQTAFRTTRVELNPVVREVVLAAKGSAKAGIPIELQLDLAQPAVIGDPDRLRQVMANLIRFSLRIATPETRIKVSTNGVGHVPEVCVSASSLSVDGFDDWLYGRYDRYEQRPSSIIGAGLELAIARVIVQMHDGNFWIVSLPHNGSEFRFSLPSAHKSSARNIVTDTPALRDWPRSG
ncbi:MAG: sensor histidine kinase [Candidatus Dormibacteraceae bacterium]